MKYDLFDLRVLDAPRDSAFDSLAWLSTEVLSVPSTLLSVLDLPRGRQHVRAQVGLTCVAANEPDLPLRHSLAHRVCALNQVVAIDDTAQDPEAANSPVIVNSGGKAYIGAPVHGPDHRPLGALEAIAPKPRNGRLWTRTSSRRWQATRHKRSCCAPRLRQSRL